MAVADDDVGPVPTLFVAATESVYVTPFVSPVTVHGDDAHDWVTVARVPSDGTAVTV